MSTYYKLATPEVVSRIVATAEIWGTYNRNLGGRAPVPTVDAYIGELPPGKIGVEFTTAAVPKTVIPNWQVQWRPGSPGVHTKPGGDLVFINVKVIRWNAGSL